MHHINVVLCKMDWIYTKMIIKSLNRFSIALIPAVDRKILILCIMNLRNLFWSQNGFRKLFSIGTWNDCGKWFSGNNRLRQCKQQIIPYKRIDTRQNAKCPVERKWNEFTNQSFTLINLYWTANTPCNQIWKCVLIHRRLCWQYNSTLAQV